MNATAPFDKVQVIERSLRCFTFGVVGLLPVIGVPFALIALGNFTQVKRRKGSIWNPAGRYLGTGALCATAGLGLTFLIVSAIAIQMWFAPASLGRLYSE
jgi:hypothetical protein